MWPFSLKKGHKPSTDKEIGIYRFNGWLLEQQFKGNSLSIMDISLKLKEFLHERD